MSKNDIFYMKSMSQYAAPQEKITTFPKKTFFVKF